MNCYKTSNNKYFDCPARMSDGRQFTDYRPNCDVNSMLQANNGIRNSFQYRNFLTHNAIQLMKLNDTLMCQKNCNSNCVEPYEEGTMLPERYKMSCNGTSCQVNEVNKHGLGLGVNYGGGCKMNQPPNAMPNQCVSNYALYQ